MACYALPISDYDACGERHLEEPAGFTDLPGHGEGFFCRRCRTLLGNEDDSLPHDLEK